MVEKIDYLIKAIEQTLQKKFDAKSSVPNPENISDWGQLTITLDSLRKLRRLAERGVLEDVVQED